MMLSPSQAGNKLMMCYANGANPYPELAAIRLTSAAAGRAAGNEETAPSSTSDDTQEGVVNASLAWREALNDARERNVRLQARVQTLETELAEAAARIEERGGGSSAAVEWPPGEGKAAASNSDVALAATGNSFLAEHLSRATYEASSWQEIDFALSENGDENHLMSVMKDKLMEFELETGRLASRAAHLR